MFAAPRGTLNRGRQPSYTLSIPRLHASRMRVTGAPSGYLHSHLADVAQGGGPETALQTPPWVLFAPIHHSLQSKVSGCPRSFLCGWITPLPGLDSLSI